MYVYLKKVIFTVLIHQVASLRAKSAPYIVWAYSNYYQAFKRQ